MIAEPIQQQPDLTAAHWRQVSALVGRHWYLVTAVDCAMAAGHVRHIADLAPVEALATLRALEVAIEACRTDRMDAEDRAVGWDTDGAEGRWEAMRGMLGEVGA